MQPGTTKPEEGTDRQPWNVLNSGAEKEAIEPTVLFIQKILRRRPFMIKLLETVMRRTIQSLVRPISLFPHAFSLAMNHTLTFFPSFRNCTAPKIERRLQFLLLFASATDSQAFLQISYLLPF